MRRIHLPMLLAGLCLAGTAQADTPPDIRDLVGARGAGGETQLIARGYANVGAETGDDRKWTYWWNPRTQTCVTVSTMDGRYEAITTSPPADCRRPALPISAQPGSAQGGGTGPGGEHWFDIGLVCFGEGKRPTLATRYGYTWDFDKGRYVYGNRTEIATQDFDASVMVQLWDGGGRIRLPNALIPPIHSRGDHGWWELDNVSTGPNMINAEYRLNGLNKPKLVIDRRSGRISVRGAGDYAFSGTCDSADNQQRRF